MYIINYLPCFLKNMQTKFFLGQYTISLLILHEFVFIFILKSFYYPEQTKQIWLPSLYGLYNRVYLINTNKISGVSTKYPGSNKLALVFLSVHYSADNEHVNDIDDSLSISMRDSKAVMLNGAPQLFFAKQMSKQ